VGAILATSLLASTAGAAERQHHLGLDGGLSMLSIKSKDSMSVGGGGGLHYAYGLTDQFNLMIEGGYAQVALEELPGKGVPNNRPTGVTNFGAGVAYVLDVLHWVPYFGLLAEGYYYTGGTIQASPVPLAVGGALAVGLDYAITRAFAMGFAFRQHFAFSKIDDYPSYSQFLLRAEIAWGW
jgi:hypothetical protein